MPLSKYVASSEVSQKLEKIIHPLASSKANGNYADLAFIKTALGEATVVGLGEITHGISECFQTKHRLLEYLVKEMDFSIFSIEANLPEAFRLNDYVLHGKGNPRELIKGMNVWTWETEEVFEMVEWMRNYNKSANKKIQFTGFDSYSLQLSCDIIKNYFTDDSLNQSIDRIIDLFNELKSNYFTDCNFTPPELEIIKRDMPLDKRFLEIKSILNYQEEYMLNHREKGQHEWVQRNLEIIKQNINELINPLAAREVAMAENIFWIQKQNPEAKIVLWAHNGHVHKHGFHDSTYAYMGEHLARALGDSYRTIGFVANQGCYTARDWSDNNKLKHDLELHLPPENSLEFKIKQFTDNQTGKENAGETLLYLDLRDPNKPEWLSEVVTARLGVGCMKESNAEYSFVPYNVSDGYDGIIYIAESHATKPLSPKPNLSTKLGVFSPVSDYKNSQEEQNPAISISQIKPQNS